MTTRRSIQHKMDSPFVNMGQVRLRQPIPNKGLEQVNPFVLLHHYGPYAISAYSNPFDLGPHPHRGFEPITLLFQGEQFHRDSLGNESLVKAGDVQWTTAGYGIIHAEGPAKAFVEKGGTLEGIQLWLNLPADKKMMKPNYQHVISEEMPRVVSDDGKITLKVVAGEQKSKVGLIETQTPVNVFMVKAKANGKITVDIPKSHEALIYLLDGQLLINDEFVLQKGDTQMITFNQDGDNFNFESIEDSNVLILSGEPIDEKTVQQGPFVMNTETQIMEAMRDYQQGKMGFLY